MTQKEIAIQFLLLAGTGKVDEAFERFVSEHFVHHNQYFESTRIALATEMIEAHASSPNKSIEVKQCFQEGDTVITHALVQKKDMDITVVHIFRFEGELIAELWDVGQILLEDSPNKIGAF